MTASIIRLPAVLDAPRAELAKLCRKLLLDAETNSMPELLTENAFLDLLSQTQNRHGSESVGEDDLWEIVREEERRVTDAACVAGLLLPKVSDLLKQRGAYSASSGAPATSSSSASAMEKTPFQAAQKETPARPVQLGIADLLDGMLDLERKQNRTSTSAPRS